MLHFVDFEVTTFDWLCVIVNPITRSETIIVNDEIKLNQYYEKYKNEIFIGYNIRGYDQYIFKGLLLGLSPQRINDFIIVEKQKGYQYSREFNKKPLIIYDVQFGLHSLKKLEGFMGDSIVESNVDFNIDHPLTDKEIAELVKYCKADVYGLIEVFLERKNEFDSHMALIKEFNLPLSYLSKTQAQLAAIILNAQKVTLDDEWDIRLPETLELNRYKYIGEWFLKKENQSYDKSLTIKICGLDHVIAWGGLHGAIENYDYTCGKDEMLIMVDVAQLYPSLMILYNLLSRAVTTPEKFKFILDESLRLKKLKMKKQREPYKRICNITYGSEGDKYNAMYDPLHRNLVCVYGQLLLIMLLEMCENEMPFFKLIQSNTDGVLILIKSKDFDLFDDIVYQWECKTGLKMEFDFYKRIIQKDVNNYIAVDLDGKQKCKGAYVKELSRLDNDLPIINKAIKEYLVNGISVEETINNCYDLIEFQQIVRLQGNYVRALHGDKILREKTFRVFASKDIKDGGIFKQKEGKNKEKFANTSDHIFIYNQSVISVKCTEKLDKNYYINVAKKRINQFKGVD